MEHLAGHVDYASGLFLWLRKTTSSFVNKTISVTSTFADDDVGEHRRVLEQKFSLWLQMILIGKLVSRLMSGHFHLCLLSNIFDMRIIDFDNEY